MINIIDDLTNRLHVIDANLPQLVNKNFFVVFFIQLDLSVIRNCEVSATAGKFRPCILFCLLCASDAEKTVAQQYLIVLYLPKLVATNFGK